MGARNLQCQNSCKDLPSQHERLERCTRRQRQQKPLRFAVPCMRPWPGHRFSIGLSLPYVDVHHRLVLGFFITLLSRRSRCHQGSLMASTVQDDERSEFSEWGNIGAGPMNQLRSAYHILFWTRRNKGRDFSHAQKSPISKSMLQWPGHEQSALTTGRTEFPKGRVHSTGVDRR